MDSVASGLGRRLGRTWSRLSALAGSGRDAPAILMYHRIATPICDPWGLSVTPNRFREQLTMLKAHRCVMSMDQLADGDGHRPRPGYRILAPASSMRMVGTIVVMAA